MRRLRSLFFRELSWWMLRVLEIDAKVLPLRQFYLIRARSWHFSLRVVRRMIFLNLHRISSNSHTFRYRCFFSPPAHLCYHIVGQFNEIGANLFVFIFIINLKSFIRLEGGRGLVKDYSWLHNFGIIFTCLHFRWCIVILIFGYRIFIWPVLLLQFILLLLIFPSISLHVLLQLLSRWW